MHLRRVPRFHNGVLAAALLVVCGNSFGQTAKETTQPAELWGDGGYFWGYTTSSALIDAKNNHSNDQFSKCLAYYAGAGVTSYSCSKDIYSGIRSLASFPNKINGNYTTFGINAQFYTEGHGPGSVTYTRDASDTYVAYRSLQCETRPGVGSISTTISSSESKLTCVKYTVPPAQCPAAGKTAGSGAPGGVGNPIQILDGTKTESHTDYVDPRGLLSVDRHFKGQFNGWVMPGDASAIDTYTSSQAPYAHYEARTGYGLNADGVYAHVETLTFPYTNSTNYGEFYAISPDGTAVPYVADASGAFAIGIDGSTVQKLSTVTAEGAIWRLRRATGIAEDFGSDGRLRRKQWPDGKYLIFAYGSQGIAGITDNWGRALTFTINAIGRVDTVTLPDGSVLSYQYSGPSPNFALTKVTYPDSSFKSFLYNESGFSSAPAITIALTGAVDENNVRTGTYKYDSSGKAYSTEAADGVNKYTMTYGGSYTYVTSPLNAEYLTYFTTVDGVMAVSSRNQPAGSGCSASSSALAYDTIGNVTSAIDFGNTRSCYAYDTNRNLETARVEGLSSSASCSSYTPANASLAAGSRKTSTTWHPDWRLATAVAEPGRITTSVYNGQPDPFAGGAQASCAPASALLPDGKPIAVLCRQVEQATTDANGSLGFSATLDSTVANREQKWTYNQWGQVLSHDGPRTDVADITTYSYYSDTSFTGVGAAAVGHTIGDLQSVTNAAGKVTQYTKYDKHGQLLESVDPNGVVSTNSYDLRQRLLSTSVGGQTTSYTYDLAGQLKRVTRPDASWIGFDYDPAHRQTAVYDNLGNRIEYTLDNAGNRTAESVKDTSGALRRQLARSIDALGRVQQVTGAQ